MLPGTVDFELLEVGIGVEQLLVVGNAVVLDPFVGADEPIGQPPDMRFPVADEEVEVVTAVAGGLGGGYRWRGRGSCDGWSWGLRGRCSLCQHTGGMKPQG